MLSYTIPGDIEEAVALLDEDPNPTIVGGGTVKMPTIAAGDSGFTSVIDISGLGLDEIHISENVAVIGACTKIAQLAVHKELAFLHSAAKSIGGPAIRNLATVGGNIFCHGDLAAALLALNAKVVLHSKTGVSCISLEKFYRNGEWDGAILTEVKFPLPAGKKFGFSKFSRRKLNSSTIVSAAVCEGDSGMVLIGLVGAAARPTLLHVNTNLLYDVYPAPEVCEMAAAMAADFESPTDSHASGKYRQQMIPVVINRAITEALAE
jgi:CO/xanthine dehydrogenase FAD-binding subunit